jgi:hypothetical protein
MKESASQRRKDRLDGDEKSPRWRRKDRLDKDKA